MAQKQRKYSKTHNINFHFDNYPNKKEGGKVKISLVVNLSGKKEYYPIEPNCFMHRKFWKEAVDSTTGKKLGHNFIQSRSNPDYEKVYPVICEAKADMEVLIRKILRKKEALTHTVLRRKWSRESDVFHKYYSNYLESQKGIWEDNTLKAYLGTAKMIRLYDPEILLAEVTWEWIQNFQTWLRNEAPNHITKQNGLKVVTISKYISCIGAVTKQARVQGDIDEDPYYFFITSKRRLKKPEPIPNPLTIEEVIRLQEAYDNKELVGVTIEDAAGAKRKQKAWHGYLQSMLISIYTGVRYSDLKSFEDPQKFKIRKSHKGEEKIYFRMKKAKRGHSILITERLRSVMVEKKDGTFLIGKVITNNSLNKAMRKILDYLGIDNQHRWHDLRATFANLVRDLSEDEFGSSKALGHSRIQTSQKHYFNRNNPQADKAVAALDKLGENGPELPPSKDVIYELQILKMLNPGIRLTPKMKEWLELTEKATQKEGEKVVIPFGVAK